MRLFAGTAHMKEATVLSKLAVLVELVVFNADLLLLPALVRSSAASPYAVPVLFPWAVRAAGCSVVEALTPRAPIFRTDRLPRKALCIYTRIYPSPGLLGVFCSLLTKVLVINHPAWPPVALAGFCYYCLVGHQFWNSCWILGRQCCSINGKALHPCGYVWYDLPRLHQFCSLNNNDLTFQ